MIIKKYLAKTEKDAMEAAKKDLGENIVIMNVKNTKKKGIFGVFSGTMVEVTVAQETEVEREKPLFAPVKETAGPLVPDAIWEKQPARSAKNEQGKEETGKAIVEKLDGLQILLQQQILKEQEEKKAEIKEEEKEEKATREEYKKKISKENETFLKLLHHTMVENEVDEKYADQLIEEIKQNGKQDMQMDFILSNVYQKMILKFGQAKRITPSDKKPKVLFFIGPTGVGKTTTIAKIASKFCVEEKKKIALLTADTYRIAAAEQLRIYANILEVPFRVIYTPDEVVQSVEEYKDFDYILVDTAGHAHQNQEQKSAICEFIYAIGEAVEKEVYLVVSATTKYKDLLGIADAYKQIEDYKLIFTKLDETTALGNLYNLRLYTGASLSYVTCGQNVPDDILPFNAQITVKQILSSNS